GAACKNVEGGKSGRRFRSASFVGWVRSVYDVPFLFPFFLLVDSAVDSLCAVRPIFWGRQGSGSPGLRNRRFNSSWSSGLSMVSSKTWTDPAFDVWLAFFRIARSQTTTDAVA